ncbi:GGDEF domain-containing protein [Colwelliaceae bacterium BS250]
MNSTTIINLGTQLQPFAVANKIKITNVVVLFTVLISALYTVFYFFVLNAPVVAAINLAITLSYAASLLIMATGAIRGAKLWFFCVLMLQLWFCTNIYLTNASGFHLFYFLVPTGAFLLFELSEIKEKFALSTAAIILLFYCENTLNETPLIDLTAELNHRLYQSVIFFIMVEVLVVLTLFSKQIANNEANLIKQATTDPLTEFANRNYFFEVAGTALQLATHHNRPFSLILIDLDNFRDVNNRCGYLAGDIYIKHVAKSMAELCTSDDILARLGGQEFIIAMPEKTISEARKVANKLATALSIEPILTCDEACYCTASMGISCGSSASDNIHLLISHADAALQRAKWQGKGRVEEYKKAI